MNSHRYIVGAIISVIFLNSCSSVKDISGTYKGDKSYITIQLNKDSTFFYRYKFEFEQKYAQGVWKKMRNNEIMLNGKIKSRVLPLMVQSTITNENDKGSLFVKMLHMPESERMLYYCSIFINDQYYVTRRCDSLSGISITIPANSFFLGISGSEKLPGRFMDTLFTEKVFPKIAVADFKVEVAFKDSLFNYKVFDNEVLKVTNKSLKICINKDWQTLYKIK